MIGTLVSQTGPISDDQLGLSKTSVFDAPAPEPIRWNTSDPGDRPAVPRSSPEEPPVIPHGVLDLAAITLSDNECVDCHEVDVKEEGEPTPIPKSHFTDFRNAPGEVGSELVGARYNCLSCHISPAENDVLVENLFDE